jgi:L-ascorbate metabolism protein UlaG (beta-lactamase superfamily)
MSIKVEWWGAACFRITYKNEIILFDPYITRNHYAQPLAPITHAQLVDNAEYLFVSDGQYVHISDVPRLLNHNPIVRVYGPETALRTIRRDGGQGTSLNQGRVKISDEVSVEAVVNGYLKQDIKQFLKTIVRGVFTAAGIKHARPALFTRYPRGQNLSYILTFKNSHSSPFRMQFLSSAGTPTDTLKTWARVNRQMDCLLLPLQGHSEICKIAADIVGILRPKTVIPHLYDDFFPPLSQSVDITKFITLVKTTSPETNVLTIASGDAHIFDLTSAPETRASVN